MNTAGLPFRTAAGGIVWPALADADAARLLALQFQLGASEYWSGRELLAHQFAQLRRLVRHARHSVPWYRQGLAGLRLPRDPGAARDAWAGVPVLTRAELQQAGSALHSERLPAGHGVPFATRSSGSTGTPVEALGTAVTQVFTEAFILRAHLWWRRNPAARLAVIRHTHGRAAYPGGEQVDGWGRATASVFRCGPAALLDIATDVADQAEWLLREAPDYLLTYPSNLAALLAHFQSAALPRPPLAGIVTIGEVVSDDLRDSCHRAWHLPIADIYSAEEIGCMALQCPHGGYHVQAEGVLLEVLDEQHAPCRPGQVGQVVVTTLHNFASPLLRYAIGDLAEAGEPCACGRGLPTLKRIVGRVRNTVLTADGRRFWPAFGSRSLTAIAPVRQYQVVQHDVHRIELRLVVGRPLSHDEEAGLRGLIRQRLGAAFQVQLSYCEHIERGPGGKFEDFVSRVPGGFAAARR